MKKKILVVLMAVAMMFALTACGGSGEQTADNAADGAATYDWKFVLGESTGSPQEYYANLFKDKVAEVSDGQFNITVYPVGQLGSGGDQGELIQSGSVEMGFLPAADATGIIPETNLLSLHYIFPTGSDNLKTFLKESAVLNEDLPQYFHDNGLTVVDWLDEGYMVWTGNKPLKTPDDFKGFKMRTMASNITMAEFEAYGASAVNIPYSELYSGLQLKMADGQTNPFEEILNMKFYEVQSDCTVSYSDVFLAALVINNDLYESLPEEAQGWIQQAIEEISDEYNEYQISAAEAAIGELEANGMTITYLTDEEIATYRELSKNVYDIYYKETGANAQDLLDKFLAEVEAYY